jgi:hypothetical protein
MISQEGHSASSRTRARGRVVVAVVGVLTLLAAAVGVRGVGGSAQAASVADLAQVRDQAVAVLDRLQVKGSTGYSVGITPSRQRIGVYLFTAPGAPAPDLVGLRASLGADADLHVVTGTPHPLERIWGGEGLVVRGGKACTTGFGIGLQDGRQGFLTAGHCFDTTQPANQQQAHTIDNRTLTGVGYNYGPSDWGIYALDNSDDQAMGVVHTANGGYPVRAVASPTVDMPICKTGITTGTTCGKITLLDTVVVVSPERDADGVIVVPSVVLRGVIMANVCAEEGDSGAAVYTDPGQVQNAPIDAVGILQAGVTVEDATGKDVCLEKVDGAGTNVAYAVPLAAISAATTNPFTVKTSS